MRCQTTKSTGWMCDRRILHWGEWNEKASTPDYVEPLPQERVIEGKTICASCHRDGAKCDFYSRLFATGSGVPNTGGRGGSFNDPDAAGAQSTTQAQAQAQPYSQPFACAAAPPSAPRPLYLTIDPTASNGAQPTTGVRPQSNPQRFAGTAAPSPGPVLWYYERYRATSGRLIGLASYPAEPSVHVQIPNSLSPPPIRPHWVRYRPASYSGPSPSQAVAQSAAESACIIQSGTPSPPSGHLNGSWRSYPAQQYQAQSKPQHLASASHPVQPAQLLDTASHREPPVVQSAAQCTQDLQLPDGRKSSGPSGCFRSWTDPSPSLKWMRGSGLESPQESKRQRLLKSQKGQAQSIFHPFAVNASLPSARSPENSTSHPKAPVQSKVLASHETSSRRTDPPTSPSSQNSDQSPQSPSPCVRAQPTVRTSYRNDSMQPMSSIPHRDLSPSQDVAQALQSPIQGFNPEGQAGQAAQASTQATQAFHRDRSQQSDLHDNTEAESDLPKVNADKQKDFTSEMSILVPYEGGDDSEKS